MNHYQILGLKKAAIVLKAVADSMQSHSTRMETLVLVECIVKAANELELNTPAPSGSEGERYVQV